MHYSAENKRSSLRRLAAVDFRYTAEATYCGWFSRSKSHFMIRNLSEKTLAWQKYELRCDAVHFQENVFGTRQVITSKMITLYPQPTRQ